MGESKLEQNAAYIIRHEATDKMYVGSTKDADKRIYQHKLDLRNGTHPNKDLQAAYDQDSNITIELKETVTREEAYAVEQELLDKGINSGNLFNIAADAKIPAKGRLVSDHTRQLISTVHKGKKLSEEHKQRLSEAHVGRVFSDEHRKNLSEANKGRVLKPETLQKAVESNSKKVVVEGTEYPSVKEASKAYGISATTAVDRLKSESERFKNWQYKV